MDFMIVACYTVYAAEDSAGRGIIMKKTPRYLAAILLIGLLLSQGPPTARAAAPKLPSGIGFDELGGKIEEYVAGHENTTAGMSVSVFHGDNTV